MNFPIGLLTLLAALYPAATALASTQEPSSWADRVQWSADFRARAELNDNSSPDDNRNRLRGRFRAGAVVTLDEEWSVGVRARTGNADDPNSPHQDLGGTGDGGFDSFELSLDQAYVTYQPEPWDGFAATFGKFSAPLRRSPVYGEFMWDSDVQPEGVQIVWDGPWKKGAVHGVGASFGEYVILENGSAEDIWSTLAQVYATVGMGNAGQLDAAVAYYFVGDTSPDGAASPLLSDNQGNAVSGTDFASQYGVLNPLLVWKKNAWAVSGEAFQNLRAADGSEDSGYSLGGSWQGGIGRLYYLYAVIGQDAVFSPWTQDDFLLGTNMASHMAGWKKPLTKDVSLHVWLLMSEADEPSLGGPDEMVYRFRIDLDFKLL